MLGGIVLSLAGSPAVAERLGYDSFHFVDRQVAFFFPALAVMIATSFLTPRAGAADGADRARRRDRADDGDAGRRRRGQGRPPLDRSRRPLGAAVRVHEAGLRRRRRLAVRREPRAGRTSPATSSPSSCSASSPRCSIAEPDFGQTMLITIAWGALFFMAGLSWFWIAALGAAAARRRRRRLCDAAARRRAHRPFHLAAVGRHLPDRQGARFDPAWRLVRAGAGRGHGQARAARRPYRLHLRGRGGGVRHHRVHRAGAGLRAGRLPRPVALEPPGGSRSCGSPAPAWSSCSACSR